jgi:hypothetical protein
MAATMAYLMETHGSVEAYLETIGLGSDTMARLRSRLAGDRSPS